eukprot:1509463-Alexandrium_andersonii.AAC.1
MRQESDFSATLKKWKKDFPQAQLAKSEGVVRAQISEKLGSKTAMGVLETFVQSDSDMPGDDCKLKRAMQTPWLLGYVGDRFFSYGVGEKPIARLIVQAEGDTVYYMA